ncbi:hypothetical protein GLI01_12740 [Gluconacetobacter liquefaciens]|nr:hypothetical protein GLI01_12740 [Gluconacetobacter liquefaciens]
MGGAFVGGLIGGALIGAAGTVIAEQAYAPPPPPPPPPPPVYVQPYGYAYPAY